MEVEMGFDKQEWSELMMMADELDASHRMVLAEYAQLFDSQGQATTNPKLVAKQTGVPIKIVRKTLLLAKEEGWLEAIQIDGRKGYRAAYPI